MVWPARFRIAHGYSASFGTSILSLQDLRLSESDGPLPGLAEAETHQGAACFPQAGARNTNQAAGEENTT